jgi:hypothetical protein
MSRLYQWTVEFVTCPDRGGHKVQVIAATACPNLCRLRWDSIWGLVLPKL